MGTFCRRVLLHRKAQLGPSRDGVLPGSGRSAVAGVRGCPVSDAEDLHARLDELTHQLRLRPGNTELLFRRGLVRADLGDLIRATEDFSHVISCDRGHHLAWVNRGVVHLQRGNHRRAVADFDEALALVPNDAMTVSDRGVAHQRLQMHDLALKDFARASQLNPDCGGLASTPRTCSWSWVGIQKLSRSAQRRSGKPIPPPFVACGRRRATIWADSGGFRGLRPLIRRPSAAHSVLRPPSH